MYTKNWSATYPGCLIILLDQSQSMEDPFGPSQTGSGQRKCDATATVLNAFLEELISVNSVVQPDGTACVRPRAQIAVLGYRGGQVTSAFSVQEDFVSLPQLQRNPLRIEERSKKERDGSGNVVQTTIAFPIWIEPQAQGGTPMRKALSRARDLAQSFATTHQDSYPPVVINLTDGIATDSQMQGDLEQVANEITHISTSDGTALLFTVHITDLKAYPVEYPASPDELPQNPFALRLSSPLPDAARTLLESLVGRPVPPNARGLIFNGHAASLLLMFHFASAPALLQVDPNR